MGFGDIIKRAWHITWRYRALWVLGLFAGVTGASSGGGGGNGYSPSSSSSGSPSSDEIVRALNPETWAEQITRFLPVLIAVTLLLLAIGFVLWIVGIAARGGLVHAVDAIEGERTFTLGAAWDAGFGRFWRLFGLSLVLGLPMALLGLGMALAVAIPVIGALRAGGQPGVATFAPMCGVLVIGVPLLVVGGVILGAMSILGTRLIMLTDVGVFQAAGEAWRLFRTRIKDVLIMWFIGLGLNVVAGLVLAIPMVVITVAATIPAIFLISSRSWPSLIGVSIGAVVIITLLIMLFTAIWGTFTSALWTVFFRRLTGREVLPQVLAPEPPQPLAAPQPPAAPVATEGATQ